MKQDKLTGILVFLVPQVLGLIMREYKIDDGKAAEMLYTSKLYETLEEEETKLWHLSAHALFDLYKEEQETGRITYPEEA
jgi:hypothetical protein